MTHSHTAPSHHVSVNGKGTLRPTPWAQCSPSAAPGLAGSRGQKAEVCQGLMQVHLSLPSGKGFNLSRIYSLLCLGLSIYFTYFGELHYAF